MCLRNSWRPLMPVRAVSSLSRSGANAGVILLWTVSGWLTGRYGRHHDQQPRGDPTEAVVGCHHVRRIITPLPWRGVLGIF